MAECPKLGACPFFNDQMTHMPNMADMLKVQYCKGDFASCARYRVSEAKGRDAVPNDMYPTDKAEADSILKE